MKMKAVLLAVGLCTLDTGCVYYINGARNLSEAPIDAMDRLHMCGRNFRLAKEAWNEVSGASTHAYSVDYAKGFKQGFADYLDAGGKGLPPEAPPYCYRKSHYQTPDGVRAVEDWFAGFRHGTAVARDSGYRETFVLPTATPGPYPEFDSSARLAQRHPNSATPPTEERLPPPRKAAPPDPGKPVSGPSKATAPDPKSSAPAKESTPDPKSNGPAKGTILFESQEPPTLQRTATPPREAPGPAQGTILFEKSP